MDQSGQVVEENGKNLLTRRCTLCHDLERVIAGMKAETEWRNTVGLMIAKLDDPEFLTPTDKKALVKYLSKSNL